MNILIQIKEYSFDREVLDFTEDGNNHIHISHSSEDSINLLSIYKIDKAVINIKGLRDAAILKYLNDYYPKVEVVVIANKAFEDLLSIFNKEKYSVINEPLRLSELKSKLSEPIKIVKTTISNKT